MQTRTCGVSLVLNGRTPTELASLVGGVDTTSALDPPLDFVTGGDAQQALAHIPRD